MSAREYINGKLESLTAWLTSFGLITGSLIADLGNWLHLTGLAIGVAIGILQLRKQWRDRNK